MSSVGQAVGGLIGAVAGFFMGGPGGALKGFSLGASIGGMLDPPKGPNQTGPRLTDLSAQTSTYGTAIPRVYGTIATMGNIFWLQGDKLTEVVTVSKNKGGKGGGGKSTTTTYSYNATFAVGLCQGEIEGVRRIWVGANLIYDAGSSNLESILASNNAAVGFKIYLGSETQTADPRMQADKGVANVPAYRGLAYIVFYDFALKDYSNSLLGAQVKVEVVKKSSGVDFSTVASAMIAPGDGGAPGVRWGADAAEFDIIRNQASPARSSKVTKYVLNVSRSFRMNLSDGSAGVPKFFYSADGCIDPPYWFEGAGRVYVDELEILRGLTFQETVSSNRSIQKRGDSYFFQSRNSANTLDTLIAYTNGVYYTPAYRVSSATGYFASAAGDFCHDIKVTTSTITSGVISANVYDDTLAITKSVSIAYSDVSGGLSTGSGLMIYAPSYAHGEKIYYLGGSSTSMKLVEIDTTSESVAYYALPNIGAAEYPRALKVFGQGALIQVMTTGNPLAGAVSVLTVSKGFAGDTDLLANIISAECVSSGLLEATDIDVTSITSEVRGYRVAETGAIRAALEPLQGAFPFDVVQRGYKVSFIPRGGSSVKAIDEAMLDARAAGNAPGVALTTSREMDSQLPRRVGIKYFDVTREYDISEQYSERLNTDAVNVQDSTLPIVLNATEAAGVAEKLLYLYWLERYNLNFTLPPEYLDLEPGDVITLTGDDFGSYEIRLTEINYTSGGWLECKGRLNNSSVYTAAAIGEEGMEDGRDITYSGLSYYQLLDIPCLQDVFDAPGFPAAMCGYSTSWPGGVIFRSNDDGQTWTDMQGFSGSVPIGIALSVLATGRTDIIDATNTLSVSLFAGELVSVTQAQLLNGANYFAIGAHGRWEIAAAQNCTLQPDGTYILSDFLRGRFGTEWAMSHAIGDSVVLLTDADMAWIGMDTASIGLERQYRGITTGAAIDTDTSLDFTYSGVNLECLSPVYLNGSRHPTTNDWMLTWIRRSRIDGALRNYVDVSLGETAEAYEVDIYADGTYATVKRTITATSQTCAYTSAQQTADFGGNQTTLYVKVYQLSATVGRGYPLTATITR